MTGSARYLCKQNWNLHIILWEAGRVKSEGASNHSCHQFVPYEMASPWLRMVFGFLTILNCTHLFAQKMEKMGGKGRHHLPFPSIVDQIRVRLQVPDVRTHLNAHACAICFFLDNIPRLTCHHQKYLVPLQVTSANLCYIHSWLLVGDICTSNDRVCKVPLQTNLKPTHHLLARWQGQVRRCLKTIHAINLFPPKWLPINCFTLTKDGLQPLNITAGGKCRHHLRLPSIVNRVDR